MIIRYKMELDAARHPFLVRECTYDYEKTVMDKAEKIVDMLNTCFNLCQMAEEHVYMVAMNTKAILLGVFEVSHGGVCTCPVSPRELYMRALMAGATGIIVVHNHPSGDPAPSKEDEIVCARIDEAGKMIGIQLFDYIVIGEGRYYSFREEELL